MNAYVDIPSPAIGEAEQDGQRLSGWRTTA